MADTPRDDDTSKKAVADTTGNAKPGSEKPLAGSDQSGASGSGDASSVLLDGSQDPHYQAMLRANRSAAGDSKANGGHDLQQKGILTNLHVSYHEMGGGAGAQSAAGSDQGQSGKLTATTGDARTQKAGDGASAERASADRSVGDQATRQRLAYLQATVQNFLPVVMAPEKGEADASLQAKIGKQQAQIKTEAEHGQFGPATRDAYGRYLQWLQKTALPSTMHDLQMFKLPVDDAGGKGLKAPPSDLQVSNDHIPTDVEMKRLDDAVRWAQAGDLRVQAAQHDLLEKVDGAYKETVARLHLPNGWVQDIDRDHARWRHTIGPLIDGALTARSNLEILDEVNKAGGTVSVADILPPSAHLERDKSGKITSLHLDLPPGWDMNNPANKERADRLNQLVAETNDLVRHTAPQLRNVAGHPEMAVNWGDTEVHDMKGRFDANNNFLGLAGKDDKPAQGEHLENINLLSSRFDVENKDGQVVVHQHVQAQEVPWWGYQNLIGAQDVGKGLDITHTFKPTDNVVVRTSTGYEVKQAQDLSSYKNWQMFKHYGEKSLMGVLDAGMVISGVTEFGSAFKAARVAGVGLLGLDVVGRGAARTFLTSSGEEIGERMLAMQAGKGLMRTTVGVTGILNNAGARDSAFGQTVNTARSAYFLADASYGMARGGWNITRSVLAPTGEAAAATGKLSLAGLTAGSRTESLYRYTHVAFKSAEYGYMPLIADDLTKGIQKAHNDKNRHVERAAEILAGDDAARRPGAEK